MCGIWALFGIPVPYSVVNTAMSNLKNRGPEGSRVLNEELYYLGFTRLAINGLNNEGMQPMKSSRYNWVCNGEIYNHIELSSRHSIQTTSGSDCEMLGLLLEKSSSLKSFFRSLDGVFAMVLVNKTTAIIGRDPYGVRPLYVCNTGLNIFISSERKAIPVEFAGYTYAFPPGHFMTIDLATLGTTLTHYHTIPFLKNLELSVEANVFCTLRTALVRSVKKRMMTERPIAALLSGGLDSSLIAALVQKMLVEYGAPPLQTYSIGFEGSEDLRCARIVANHIKSHHTEIVMTPDDFFKAIPSVVYDIESYDITTVRASVGNWLVSREISKRSNCKVVFNGDGSDEVFGGYLYFRKCPTQEEFDEETERLLENIHYFDVLRSDRCISSHGLEPRTPFLDKEFVNIAKSIPTQFLLHTYNQPEKWALRSAFVDLLPPEILWRKKEAFSDGVSTVGKRCWYQECQQRSKDIVGEWDVNEFSYLPPKTAEGYYYRKLYSRYYGSGLNTIPFLWMPKWSPETDDPSAKTLNPTAMDTS